MLSKIQSRLQICRPCSHRHYPDSEAEPQEILLGQEIQVPGSAAHERVHAPLAQ